MKKTIINTMVKIKMMIASADNNDYSHPEDYDVALNEALDVINYYRSLSTVWRKFATIFGMTAFLFVVLFVIGRTLS